MPYFLPSDLNGERQDRFRSVLTGGFDDGSVMKFHFAGHQGFIYRGFVFSGRGAMPDEPFFIAEQDHEMFLAVIFLRFRFERFQKTASDF